ncbi:hypothetical protein ACNGTO_03125 [Bisgaard Taxon 45]
MNVVSIALASSSLALAIAGGLLVPDNLTSGLSCLMLASIIGIVSMVISILTMED